MHPLFFNRTSFLLYLAVWLPFGLMFGVILSVLGRLPWQQSLALSAPLTLALAFLCLSPWFACRAMPFATSSPLKMIAQHTLAAIVASGFFVALARLVARVLSHFFPHLDQRLRSAVPLFAIVAFLMYVLSTGFHYAVLAAQASRKAEVLARHAELKALKAQVNPHFLFNSLNSISALTAIDPQQAREMCVRLSDFLRISLRLGERSSISFAEEIELAKTYLDVEQVRFGDRLRVVSHVDDACGACDVPPLLVQPLVENAIKHGIATLVEGGEVILAGVRFRDILRFSVENPFDPEAPVARQSGIGLRNVRDRLQARYGSAAQLHISVTEARYRVEMTVPFEPSPVPGTGS